jgi:hypothetical protein
MARLRRFRLPCDFPRENDREWTQMGYLLGQKQRKVGRLQRQAARCFLVTREGDTAELGTWCWPRVVLIERRPLTESERSSMNRAARSVGAQRVRRLGRNNWIWRLPDDVAGRAQHVDLKNGNLTRP